jgi:tRNA(fMet)-specific endonuclease VapC
MGIVLDSSVIIAAERKRFDLAGLLAAHSDEPIAVTAVTASELLHGCLRANHPNQAERRGRFVEKVLHDFAVLPFTLVEARIHARLWVALEKAGAIIGERDLLIAAIAVTHNYALATLNRNEFARVPGLTLITTEKFLGPSYRPD